MQYLNTSYVKVQYNHFLYHLLYNMHLNTSYVKVQYLSFQKKERNISKFKYILC